MVANRSGQLVGAAEISILSVRPSEMEISQKNILDQKTKMVSNRSGQLLGAADTSVSPVRSSEMEKSQKKYFEPKNENGGKPFRATCRRRRHLRLACAYFRN